MATNYHPEATIQHQLGLADRFRNQPIVPHWTGVLAQGLGAVGGNLLTGSAFNALDQNRTTMADVLRRAGEAPDNTAASRILMDSGIPGMGEKGLGFLMDSRSKAADREAQARMQRENFEFQKRLAMDLENQKRTQMMEAVNSILGGGAPTEAAQPPAVPGEPAPAPAVEGAPAATPAPAMGAPAATPSSQRITPRQAARLVMAGVPKPVVEMLMQRDGVPKETADMEQSLRKEYATLAKPYFEVRDAYSRVEQAASQPSAAGDLALIFNYMKMLDPGSVVREGEFATAQNAAGVPDRVRNLWNRLLSGERLNEAQRGDFVGQARGLFQRQERQYQKIQNQYQQISQRLGLDPSNTILDFTRPDSEAGQTLQEARDAIAKGAPRDQVIERLRQMGIDPSGL